MQDTGSQFKTHRFWLIAVLITASGVVAGQVVDTNRPGFSFSPNTVGHNEWQVETGLSYSRDNDDSRTTSLPWAEIRFGMGEQFEIFISSLTWSETESSGGDFSGTGDITLGTKFKVSDAAATTQMALLFQFSAPTGDRDYTSDRWDPSIAFIWAHSGTLPIAGTVKISKFGNGFQLDNGLKLPFSFSDSHSAFLEWEANMPEGGGDAHWLNGGFQWLLNDHTQIDVNAGLGLNDRAADYRLGFGFSILL
jgi:hypothetical protein